MTGPYLLDTNALVFLTIGDLGRSVMSVLERAYQRGTPLFVSPISAWEIGLLVARGRYRATSDPFTWFRNAVAQPGIRLAALPPEVLIGSSFLPGRPPRDPADRIVLASARSLGATVITSDRAILDYAAEGHVAALAC